MRIVADVTPVPLVPHRHATVTIPSVVLNSETELILPRFMSPSSAPPSGDPEREAIHAIRGYEYQVLAAALAWIDIDENGILYLEVAEDYAEIVDSAINAVQVKDTYSSGRITLNSVSVRNAIASFVDLTERNLNRQVRLRFLTTSSIGREKAASDRPGGMAGLDYWQRVRSGQEDIGPLREVLERSSSTEAVRRFCETRSDDELCEELIRRITWDCNSPDATNLRRELEQRLVIVLSEHFRIPSQEAPRVADTLAYRVLQKSALPDVGARVLSRAELHELVDSSTRLSLPRAALEPLLCQLLADRSQSHGGQAVISSLSRDDPHWLIDGSRVPAPKTVIPRPTLELAVKSSLKLTGVCFIFGSTGIGKSMLARAIASTFSGGVRWIDLRDAEFREVQIRLNQAVPLLGGMGPSTLILEDLNSIEAPTVQLALAKLVEAARRHDMRLIVTCYRQPSAMVLNGLGLDSESVVACRHFDQDETNSLVVRTGGDPSLWGKVAYIVGGDGHPQLTHAFIFGMAAKDWPKSEITQVVARGFTSPDLEAVWDASRANLITSLPEAARDLLYRLSITTGIFKRSLALAIGAMPPSLPRVSECFDQLIGPWVESATSDRYRSSPLTRGFGSAMLTTEEKRQVHHIIASQTLSDTPIDAGDIDAILIHGLAGESKESLWKLSQIINMADEETRVVLAKHLVTFCLLDTSKPIFPKDLPTSVMLRLGQLRLVAASDEPEGTADIVRALLREVDTVPRDPEGHNLEIAVVSSILNNLGIANHVRGWVKLLSRFRRLELANKEGALLSPEQQLHISSATVALFNIGIAGLDSAKKLENIFQDLDALDSSERRDLLTPIDPSYADYFLIVHHPWNAESRQPGFDAASAAARYERMARAAQAWGDRTLSLQCSVAEAAILDEHLGDMQSAIRVLNQAEASIGKDLILTRAFAKLHYRNGQNAEALISYRNTVPHIGAASHVDAAYTLREAAICAAQCGEWDTARSWFLRAQTASKPLQAIGLGAIRIGLGADAAVASFEIGNLQDALSLLKDTLLALEQLDPDSNLQAAHCHRLVRHTILWLQAKVEGRDTKVQGEPIAIIPGACSNPEPIREIQKHSLGHIVLAWYMLAEVETAAGLDLGIRGVLTRITTQGHVPLLEHSLRIKVLAADIETLDPVKFSTYLSDYVASAKYCLANSAALQESFDPIDPERIVIPPIRLDGTFDPSTERAACGAILAYCVRSLLNRRLDAISCLRDALGSKLGQSYPGKSLFDNWATKTTEPSDLDSEIAAILSLCLRSDRLSPDLLFLAGLRLLDWITQSPFKPVLIQHLAPWLRDQWRRVLQTERFLLYTPMSTVPAIEAVLNSQAEGEQFAARLALVAGVAVNVRLDNSLRERLYHFASKSAD